MWLITRAIRRFVRDISQPIPSNTASRWNRKLNIVYAICCWNAFGAVVYLWYKGKGDWAEHYGLKGETSNKSQGEKWVDVLKIDNENVTFVHVAGLTKAEWTDRVSPTSKVASEELKE